MFFRIEITRMNENSGTIRWGFIHNDKGTIFGQCIGSFSLNYTADNNYCDLTKAGTDFILQNMGTLTSALAAASVYSASAVLRRPCRLAGTCRNPGQLGKDL